MSRIGIMTDSGCDLSKELLERFHIGVVHFLVQTDSGLFVDGDEITSENILEYMLNGGKKAITSVPEPGVYSQAFEDRLTSCDEVIFIALGSGVDNSYREAVKGVAMMRTQKSRVHIFDSKQLSTGQGLIVLRAAKLAGEGMSVDDILDDLSDFRERVSTTFIMQTADFLYMNERTTKSIRDWCRRLHAYPVMQVKDGMLKLKSVQLGVYADAWKRYLKQELRHPDQIDREYIFITHAKCPVKMIHEIQAMVTERCPCENLVVTDASAAISGNCGLNTFGVLFVRKKQR